MRHLGRAAGSYLSVSDPVSKGHKKMKASKIRFPSIPESKTHLSQATQSLTLVRVALLAIWVSGLSVAEMRCGRYPE